MLAYQAGRYEEAEGEARALRSAVADFFPAVLLLGMIAGKTGRSAEGIELLRAAVALDHRSAEARGELAALLRAAGRQDEAVAAARHALRLQPKDAGAHNNLGLCYLAAGRVPAALTHLQRAIALKPEAAAFHHNLGLALRQQARDFEAIGAFRASLSLVETNSDAHAHLGQLLVQHGAAAEGAGHYERAAALQPDRSLAAVHRAEGLIGQGRSAQAEECLRAALRAEPRADLAHQVLGVLLQQLGRFDEASASFERAIEAQPRRISAYTHLVRGRRIGAGEAALLEIMQRLVRDRSLAARERSALHFSLGKACEDLGDYKGAIGHFDRANEIEQESLRQAGRWFDRRARADFVDRTIADYPAGCFARFGPQACDSELPILIVGMPRSGTTLIEQILSSHPAIGAAGEVRYWTDRPLAEYRGAQRRERPTCRGSPRATSPCCPPRHPRPGASPTRCRSIFWCWD